MAACQRAHAVSNGCFVAAINRVGVERGAGEDAIEFWGGSFVANPSGQIIAEASDSEEEELLVEADRSEIEFSRTHWPFLRDRRVDAYQDLTQRYLE